MLNKIVSEIIEILKKHGAENVYSAFDGIRISQKNKDIFCIAGIESFESSAPIYSSYTAFIPFKAEAVLSLTAPADFRAETLYEYFDKYVLPAFEELSCLSNSLKCVSIKKNSNIDRLVLKADFTVRGITRMERSGT